TVEQCIFGPEPECVDKFGFEGERMDGASHASGTVWATIDDQCGAWRICAAGLVAMRIRAINQGLIGKIELRRPVDRRSAGELIPLLIHNTADGITIAGGKELARNIGEMLLVFRPAKAADQFQIIENIVIYFAEGGVGIQRVGV